jgi:two-component system, OmpR family, sensor kinase
VSFRARTALVVLALTAGTMGAAFFLVWESFVASQRHQLDMALLAVAIREADEARAGGLELTDAPGPSANAVGPLPKHAVIYSANGTVLSTTNNFRTVPELPSREPGNGAFDFEHDGQPMRALFIEVGGKGPPRRILVATTRDDLEDDGRILGRAMGIAWVVGCFWAAFVAFVVATRLTSRHRLVADIARKVARGDTSARVRFRSVDTDLKNLADDLNAMIERLVELVESQERFVSHAAHELRTPLASLRLEIELARRTCTTPEAYAEALDGTLESVERLSALADDLLELARETSQVDIERTSLREAVDAAVRDVGPLGGAWGVALEVSSCDGTIAGPPLGIARIVRNVLENAVNVSPTGATVRVVCEVRDDAFDIRIVDEGPGVSEADAERIFEPFVRGAARNEAGGAGLGLAITKQLVKRLGGNVRAEPGPAGVFVVSLPRARECDLSS